MPRRLFAVFGVPVVAEWSTIILVAVLTVVSYVELEFRGGGELASVRVVLAIVGSLVFLASILAHEVSHTWMARQRGVAVKQIRLHFLGGASELEDEEIGSVDDLVIAAAGPAMSGLLGIAGWAASESTSGSISTVLLFIGLGNLLLAGFNLLPVLPLDGGRVMRDILWMVGKDRHRATEITVSFGRVVGLVAIGIGTSLILRSLVGLGVWVVVTGAVLLRFSAVSYRYARLERATGGRTVADVMQVRMETVSFQSSLRDVLDGDTSSMDTRLVEEEGRVVGLFGALECLGLDLDTAAETNVGEVMSRLGPADVVSGGDALLDALMRRPGATHRFVVVDCGRVIGLVEPDQLTKLLFST